MSRHAEKTKRKMPIGLKIFLIMLIIIIVMFAGGFIGGYLYLKGTLSKMNYVEINAEAIGIKEDTKESLKEYRNIALFGIDSRADNYGKGNRTDTIIIASLNNKTNEVSMVSVYRDTYLLIEENGYDRLDKVNHAYSYGGPEGALYALNRNLDLNISEFVAVNFDAVIAVVDEIGGIELDIDENELWVENGLNHCIDEQMEVTGVKSSHITSGGIQTVDGCQALAYARVRNTAGGDYRRSEKQREVIEAVTKKVKSLGVGEIMSLVDVILPKVSTNISADEIIGLIPSAIGFKIGETNEGWPFTTKGATIDGVWYGVPVTLAENVTELHKDLFNQNDYKVPEDIQNISDSIEEKSGYHSEEE